MMHRNSHLEPATLREKINSKRVVVIAVIVGLLALAGYKSYQTIGPAPKPNAFYSVDDGKTWFVATLRAVPFDYHGKEAVRAMVFSCDGGKTTFCGYLMRYKPEARKLAQDRIDKKAPAGPESGMEIKRPGDAEWVSAFDPRNVTADSIAHQQANARKFAAISNVTSPDGGSALPQLINPP